MPLSERKDERVELRTTGDEKRLLVAAAAYEHMDLTAFVLHAVLPAARRAVDRATRLRLSRRDTALVLDLLEHPPVAPAKLLRVAEELHANRVKLAEHDSRESVPRARRVSEENPTRSSVRKRPRNRKR